MVCASGDACCPHSFWSVSLKLLGICLIIRVFLNGPNTFKCCPEEFLSSSDLNGLTLVVHVSPTLGTSTVPSVFATKTSVWWILCRSKRMVPSSCPLSFELSAFVLLLAAVLTSVTILCFMHCFLSSL
ncbi:hypothetical protein V6N13_023042 [Hibiscus sabdariffa]